MLMKPHAQTTVSTTSHSSRLRPLNHCQVLPGTAQRAYQMSSKKRPMGGVLDSLMVRTSVRHTGVAAGAPAGSMGWADIVDRSGGADSMSSAAAGRPGNGGIGRRPRAGGQGPPACPASAGLVYFSVPAVRFERDVRKSLQRGAVAQLVRVLDCRSSGCGFESRPRRFLSNFSKACRNKAMRLPAGVDPVPISGMERWAGSGESAARFRLSNFASATFFLFLW